jgi:hypothetical protein
MGDSEDAEERLDVVPGYEIDALEGIYALRAVVLDCSSGDL